MNCEESGSRCSSEARAHVLRSYLTYPYSPKESIKQLLPEIRRASSLDPQTHSRLPWCNEERPTLLTSVRRHRHRIGNTATRHLRLPQWHMQPCKSATWCDWGDCRGPWGLRPHLELLESFKPTVSAYHHFKSVSEPASVEDPVT